MLCLQIYAPFDYFSLGPLVFAPELVCSSQRCASDSSSPPRLALASAPLMNTGNHKQNSCHLQMSGFTQFALLNHVNQAETEPPQKGILCL